MDIILTALTELLDPFRMLMLAVGVFSGLIVGVVPGIGGIFGLALLIPMTYHLDAYSSFALLLGMASVINTSDTIPAILLGVPGTVGAVATVVDGHPMAQKGEAARAFGAAYTSSMIGGLVGAVLLAAAIPVIRPLVLYLNTPDFLSIGIFGLSMVAMLAGSQPIKGMCAALLGLLVSFVGIDANAGWHRWTFNQVYFWDGLPIVVVFLGLFGLPELATLLSRGSIQEKLGIAPSYKEMFKGVREALQEWFLVVRCGGIGTVLGAIPGVGVAAIDWIAYGHAASRPGNGPPFGQGNVRGVIAPESANNAKEGGSLIPTLAFGVPGSASMAILLGAFMVQGLIPGPEMLEKHASLTVSMIFTIAIANILGAGTCLLLTRQLAGIANIPAMIIVPIAVTFMIIGCYQNNMSVLDLLVLGGIGIVGMTMKELNWPRSAFSLGFVLGPTLERNFFLTYQIHGWNWVSHPVAVILLVFSILIFSRRGLFWYRNRNRRRLLPRAIPDLLFSAFLLALSVTAFVSAAGFPFEAGIFPMVSAGLLSVLVLVVTIQALWRWHRGDYRQHLSPEGEWSPGGEFALDANLKLLGIGMVLSVIILLIGHLAAGFVFIAGTLLIMRAARPHQAIIYALVSVAVIYLVFDFLVSRPWPVPFLYRFVI